LQRDPQIRKSTLLLGPNKAANYEEKANISYPVACYNTAASSTQMSAR